MLAMQEAQVPSLVRELDPTRHTRSSQLKDPGAATETQINKY